MRRDATGYYVAGPMNLGNAPRASKLRGRSVSRGCRSRKLRPGHGSSISQRSTGPPSIGRDLLWTERRGEDGGRVVSISGPRVDVNFLGKKPGLGSLSEIHEHRCKTIWKLVFFGRTKRIAVFPRLWNFLSITVVDPATRVFGSDDATGIFMVGMNFSSRLGTPFPRDTQNLTMYARV